MHNFNFRLLVLPLFVNIFNIGFRNEDFMQKYIFCLIVILVSSVQVLPQDTYDFLNIDVSPRAAALGGSLVAGKDDPDVIFYNTAGIRDDEEIPVSFGYLKHLLDINCFSLSGSYHLENAGNISGGIHYINYGTFTGADKFGNKTGSFSGGEMALVAGYSNYLDTNFTYGVNIKYVFSSLAGYNSSALAFDFGLLYDFTQFDFQVGLSARNLGFQLASYLEKNESLPIAVDLGISKGLKFVPIRYYITLHNLEEKNEKVPDIFKRFSVAAELNASKIFTIRLGYNNKNREDYKTGSSSGIAGISAGVGINIQKYRFDYTYSSMGEIGSLSRFGISTSF